MRNLRRLFILITCFALLSPLTRAQSPEQINTWLTRVNDVRLNEGLAPYHLTDNLLTAAAQRHADNLAANMTNSHIGSDDSTPEQRIAQAGYVAWTSDSGEAVVGENTWIGTGTIEDAMAFFLGDPPSRGNLLSSLYREIGIGVATDTAGRTYCVLNFGARPSVLPIFINDGALNAEAPQVAIRLTNEEVRPGGQRFSIGRAIEIRIGNDPNWDILTWQSWEPLVPWTLPETPGEHTVYVQFRDAAGRTAASADSIYLGEEVPPTPVPATLAPDAGDTPVPEATAAPGEVTTLELTPTPSRSPAPVPITITPFPTWTPLPTPTVGREEPASRDTPLGLVAALQVLALIFGLYLALHRRGEPEEARAPDDGQDT